MAHFAAPLVFPHGALTARWRAKGRLPLRARCNFGCPLETLRKALCHDARGDATSPLDVALLLAAEDGEKAA
jgi:hypothetical protein